MERRILIIDNNVSFLNDVESLFRGRLAVTKARTGREGLEILRNANIAAVLLDLDLPDMPALDVMQKIHRDHDPRLPVVVVSEYGDMEHAVECMKQGAYDFIPKDFHRDVLAEKILKALEVRSLELKLHALQTTFDCHHDRMVFASDVMKRINYETTRIAALPFDVLIAGETGAGKDFIAYEIHRRSPRRDKPFIPLAMRTLAETLIESELFGYEKGAFSGADTSRVGKLEAAHGGTVYIPEVSCLSESVQLKLLYFLQYKTISRVGQDARRPETKLDVRLIMATNEDLEELVGHQKVRADFFHRISGVRLLIPPLRERVDDIEALARHFLKKHSASFAGVEYSFAPEVITEMRLYRWPGNARELENAIKNALVYSASPQLTLKDFPVLARRSEEQFRCSYCLAQRADLPGYGAAEKAFRRGYFEEALRRAGGVVSRAAALTGMSTQGFRKVLRTLSINHHNGQS
jgi:DNA-binding NtrC family response regulator